MKGSSMISVENDTLVIVRKSYCVAFGSACAAALVNFYSFWHDVNLSKFEQQKEFNKTARQQGQPINRGYGLLQGHKQAQLVDAMQGLFTKHEIVAANKSLIEIGVITIHKNPLKGYNFDRTNYFLFHPKKANSILAKSHIQTMDCPHTDNGETAFGQWIVPIRTSNSKENNKENNKESESTPTQKIEIEKLLLSIQGEKEQSKEEAPRVSLENKLTEKETPLPLDLPANLPKPFFNPKAKKEHKSHLEIFETVKTLWRECPEYANTVKAVIAPLGISDNTPALKVAFFDFVESIFCASIMKASEFALSAVDIQNAIIQKIGYNKDEIRALKPIVVKSTANQNKTPQNQNKAVEENEKFIVAYCKFITGNDYTTVREFQTGDQKDRRMAMKAIDDIEGTKYFLIENGITV